MIVLGVDPGLTRCGVGVVAMASQKPQLVHVSVLRSAADDPIEQRLLQIGRQIGELIDEHRPDAIAVERVFSQHNVRTVMGTAQVAGLVLVAAAERGIPVAMHTPTQVKAAVTGNGRAGKEQVTTMVTRLLGLDVRPHPADAADALALALCHGWQAPMRAKVAASR